MATPNASRWGAGWTYRLRRIGLIFILPVIGLLLPCRVQSADAALRVHAQNRHYFEYKGQPILLIGATHKDGWTPICLRDRDFRRDLERLASVIREADNPHVRGLVRVMPYFPDFEGPQPWQTMDDGRYNLRRFDPEWERRLREYLDLACKLDLIVSLEVWDDFSITREPGGSAPPGVPGWKAWGAHPFHPENNVNYGPETLPSATDLDDAPFYRSIPERDNNTRVLSLQQAYVDRLISISRPHPNVVYNISNESRASLAWSRYWATYIRRRVGKSHLITEMPSTAWQGIVGERDSKLGPVTLLGDPLYDYVDISQLVCKYVPSEDPHFHALGGAQAIGELYRRMESGKGIKPVVVSKHYTNTRPSGIPIFWAMFTGGAAGVRFHRPVFLDNPKGTEDFQFDQVLHLAEFTKDVRFWKMRPSHELASDLPEGSHALVLAEPGVDYVVQILGARAGEFTLRVPAGRYTARWYDPAEGRYLGESMKIIRSVEGRQAFSIPVGKKDLILRAKR